METSQSEDMNVFYQTTASSKNAVSALITFEDVQTQGSNYE